MFEAEVKVTEPQTVAFVAMRGAYSQVPQAMGRVYGWAAQHGLQPAGMPSAVYYTDPATVPEADALWEVRAPVAGDPPECEPDASGCGVKRIVSRKVASTMHRGPYESIAGAYASLGQWVAQEGLTMIDAPEELYYSDPANTKPEDYLTEIRFPVA